MSERSISDKNFRPVEAVLFKTDISRIQPNEQESEIIQNNVNLPKIYNFLAQTI